MAFDENLNSNETNGKTGKRLAILSIDGGGVRGIIPALILEVLQGYLQVAEEDEDKNAVYAKDKNAGESNKTTHHLWEYFDIIAGTSSGGLITAMITIPVDIVKDQPARTHNATEVVAFFDKYAETIFPERFTGEPWLHSLWDGIVSIFRNVYDAGPLEALLRGTFGEALLSRALTSVIIPAFDTAKQRLVLFSDLKEVDKENPLYDVYVKDACRATTAVPILFPPAVVEEQVSADRRQPDGPEVFNVIDGGIAVNDPTLVAVTQAIAKKQQALAEEQSRDCMDFSNVLVLSLGTGEHPISFLGKPHWSSVQWLLNPSGSPLLNRFLSASEDMVEYYTSMIFDAHKSGHHYLRIQTNELSESEFLSIDDADKENLSQLENASAELVRFHNVYRRNFAPRKPEAITDYGTALYSFARLLVEERRKLPTTDHSGKGKSKLQGKFGRTRRRSPRDEKKGPDAVQTPVGGCSLMMGEVILVFVVFAVLLLRVICHVAGF